MKVARRGIAASFAAIALLSASALFHDFLVEIASLCVLAVIVSEALWVSAASRRPESKILLTKEEPGPRPKGKAILYPGDESVERVRLLKRIGGKVEFSSRVHFLRIEPKAVDGDAPDSTLEFRFRTPYAGEYSGRDVGIELTSPLGLFSSRTSVSLAQKYTVYPRLLSVAAATIKLLGKGEIGETPIEMPGVGSEFYEMRGYQPGDEFRSVNWKATARRGELVVNEHMREVGSSFLLVLDARAPGFYDTDRLASTFLSIANSLASSGVSFGILVHDGIRVTATSSEYDPRASLGMALKAAVSIAKLDSSPEFLELSPVRASLKLASVVGGLGEDSSLAQIPGIRRAQLMSAVLEKDPWASASRYIRDRSTRSVIYVSGLFEDLEPLIELAWQARHYRDADFSVANPCEPWAWAETFEEAYKLYTRYQKHASALAAAGIKHYRGEPLDLASRILSV